MDRGRAAGAAWLILIVTLPGAAQAEVSRHIVLHADDAMTWRFDAEPGSHVHVDVETRGRPVDVLVIPEEWYETWRKGRSLDDPGPGGALGVVDHEADAHLPDEGRWIVVVDNTGSPPDGVSIGEPVIAKIRLDVETGPGPEVGAFEALVTPGGYVPVGDDVGVAGWVLWTTALTLIALPKDRRGLAWVGVVAATTIPVSPIGPRGVATHTLVPALVGTLAGLDAVRRDRSLLSVQRRAGAATFLGALIGADLVATAWAPAGSPILVVGGDGLLDALLIAPVLALALASAAWCVTRSRTEAEDGWTELLERLTKRWR